MEEDELQGFIPFFISTTLGTTGSCSFDAIYEIGQVIQRFPRVWMHVDAAYAGNAFICPEFKPLLKVLILMFYHIFHNFTYSIIHKRVLNLLITIATIRTLK